MLLLLLVSDIFLTFQLGVLEKCWHSKQETTF